MLNLDIAELTASIHLTFLPEHTSHSRGHGQADRSGTLGAAGIQPRASSAAGTRTTQSCSVMHTTHTKLPEIRLQRIDGPNIPVEQCKMKIWSLE